LGKHLQFNGKLMPPSLITLLVFSLMFTSQKTDVYWKQPLPFYRCTNFTGIILEPGETAVLNWSSPPAIIKKRYYLDKFSGNIFSQITTRFLELLDFAYLLEPGRTHRITL